MLTSKPNRDHIYTCRLDNTLDASLTDYKNITNNLNKFETEPGFKICKIRVTDFDVITMPVENHEEDQELQKDNLFLKCKLYCDLERDTILKFLDEVKETLSSHQLWNPVMKEDGTILFKIEGDIYIKDRLKNTGYQLYNSEDYKSLNRNCKNREIHLNLLLYRMCDLITHKFCWAVCQTGISFF